MNRWREFWHARSPKEQRLLILAAMVILVALLYQGLYRPMNHLIREAEQNAQQDRELLAWMQENAPKVLQQRNGAKTTFKGSLFAVVERPMKALGDDSVRITRQDERTVLVSFTQVAFDDLITALVQLQREQGVSVDSLKAISLKEPGFVQVSFKLTHS